MSAADKARIEALEDRVRYLIDRDQEMLEAIKLLQSMVSGNLSLIAKMASTQ